MTTEQMIELLIENARQRVRREWAESLEASRIEARANLDKWWRDAPRNEDGTVTIRYVA